ncbi:hypothetical protein [Streptosporangium lutulentum]|uniref:HEAT repeat-containing protein n=1 Tax=Streptosporangium lutulentum TaxID=1461250 RepID=A0ABT9QU44_9ACTN|nr:hypothetical protein [Streptosporangium lutulentum]MDP9849414.1 hypothetical protein [Streptosporangium lutulentum]
MNPDTWKLGDDPLDDRPTFLAHALTMSLRYGPGPWPEDACELPDDPPRRTSGEPFIPSVVMDGIRSHHFGVERDDGVAEVTDLIGGLVTGDPARDDLLRLHDRLATVSALGIADDLVDRIRRRLLPKDRVGEVGRYLAGHGSHRNAVKIGIVLLGACGDERDRELLLLLGTLEELTLYAVIALRHTQPDRHRAVYELARRVRGWGRIHAVERLKDCDDPQIKAWLLRDGFRNGIMNEYLAHLAATTGGLYSALLEPDVDDALLDGAGDILAALALGGPAEDMGDYADAVPAMDRLADLLIDRRDTLGRLHAVLRIQAFLRGTGDDSPWPPGVIARLRRRYEEITAQPRWNSLVLRHLADPHHVDFDHAMRLAHRLRLPVVPQIIARLKIDPLDEFAWYHAIRLATAEEAEQLGHLAERLLPPADPANGPDDRPGFGDEYRPDRALESVVSGLGAFPGLGLPLIDVALRNRAVQTRRAALEVLSTWPASAVPDEAGHWIRRAASVEPHEGTRTEMIDFLRRRRTRMCDAGLCDQA